MTATDVTLLIAAATFAGIGWFFFAPRRAGCATLAGGVQEATVVVKGGSLAAGRVGAEDLALLRRCDDPTEVATRAMAAHAAQSAMAAPALIALAPEP